MKTRKIIAILITAAILLGLTPITTASFTITEPPIDPRPMLTAFAAYNQTTGNVVISWNSELPPFVNLPWDWRTESLFDVAYSTDNINWTMLEYPILPNISSYTHEVGTEDFQVLYYRVRQILTAPGAPPHSATAFTHVIWSPQGVRWQDYMRPWTLEPDHPRLSQINNNNPHYQISLEYIAAGVPGLHLNVRNSPFSNAMRNDSILGTIPEINYTGGLAVENVTVKFHISEASLENRTGVLAGDLIGIHRFELFMWINGLNTILPVNSAKNSNNNTISMTFDEFGHSICVVDLEKFFPMMGVPVCSACKRLQENCDCTKDGIVGSIKAAHGSGATRTEIEIDFRVNGNKIEFLAAHDIRPTGLFQVAFSIGGGDDLNITNITTSNPVPELVEAQVFATPTRPGGDFLQTFMFQRNRNLNKGDVFFVLDVTGYGNIRIQSIGSIQDEIIIPIGSPPVVTTTAPPVTTATPPITTEPITTTTLTTGAQTTPLQITTTSQETTTSLHTTPYNNFTTSPTTTTTTVTTTALTTTTVTTATLVGTTSTVLPPAITTTAATTTTEPVTTRKLGDITDTGDVTITDALELLMFLAGLPNQLEDDPQSMNAARITVQYPADPTIACVLEILMYLASLPSLIED